MSGCDSPSTSLAVCGENLAGDWLTTGSDWTSVTTFAVTDRQITLVHEGGPEPDPNQYNVVSTADSMTFAYRIASRDESRCELSLEATYPPPNEQHKALWVMRLDQTGLCWQQNIGDWEGPQQCYRRP
jgi:hypothetical protein